MTLAATPYLPLLSISKALGLPRFVWALGLSLLTVGAVASGQGVALPDSLRLPSVSEDESRLSVRRFDEETLNGFREDSDFDYEERGVGELSLWRRFLLWLSELFDWLPDSRPDGGGSAGFAVFFKYLVAAVCVGLLVFAILRLYGVSVTGLFSRKAATARVSGEVLDGDLRGEDLGRLVSEAEAHGRYREAVRYRFLRSLRRLADRGLVQWRETKTNREYLGEIENDALRSAFASVTRVYEYVWYGEGAVDAPGYERFKRRFEEFDRNA